MVTGPATDVKVKSLSVAISFSVSVEPALVRRSRSR